MTKLRSPFYQFLYLSIVLVSCSRYNNIPRQLSLFDHSKSKSTKQDAISKHKEKELKVTFNSDDNHTSMNETAAIQPSTFKSTNSVLIAAENSKRNLFTPTKKLLTHHTGNRAIELQKISYHQARVKEHLKRLNPNKATDDPEEKETEFHPLAALSGFLGVISWAALIFMELYWMAFWSEYLILVSILAAIGALVTGIIALVLTKKSKGDFNNRYMAVIGIVMGGIEILALLLVFISLLFFFGL